MAVQDDLDSSPPLYEVFSLKSYPKHLVEVFVLFLLLLLVVYRFLSYDGNSSLVHLLAFSCEAWFSLVWFMVVCIKWTPIHNKTYPERLLQRFQDLPPVDIFVTTADPKLEPPTITMNTVISFLAADYDPDKLAIYVSDDSASPITLFSLIQAYEFSKQWVPFCKKYKIQVRAPFRYFQTYQTSLEQSKSPEFQQKWQEMKSKYDQLIFNVDEACKLETTMLESKEFDAFSNSKHNSHDSIVKVITANEGVSNGLPNLIYVAREKRPEHNHHYKAGAMNVLTRVSGVMTNAPFMLNVDCDMFNNNPQTFHHAMCLFLGSKTEQECVFVQFPQVFYNGLKDDPFGNHYVVQTKKFMTGISGIQGPFYIGTGTIHRRKLIYDLPLDYPNEITSGPDRVYGEPDDFIDSIQKSGTESSKRSILDSLEAAHEVARCDYEYGTEWGVKIGWLYGSVTEDILTGITIHSKGYKSMYCDPEPPSFMGCAPPTGPLTTGQVKRWTTGLLEIFFSKKNPIILSLTSNIHLRQSLAYTWILVWGIRSIPEILYSFLPAYCIVSNSAFLPNADGPALLIPLLIFLIYNAYTLVEFLQCKLSFLAWWNNQRVSRMNSTTAFLFGFIDMVLNVLGLSETVFSVTSKGTENDDDGHVEQNAGRFTFDESPIYVPATTLVLVNLAAFGLGFVKVIWAFVNGLGWSDVGFGPFELGSCVWLLLMFSPFVKGLFGKGRYGIPFGTILKSLGWGVAFFSLRFWS